MAKSTVSKAISLPPSSSSPPRREQGEALGQYAARVLRAAIRSGELTPGERLREADVATWLEISRTPVREAFQSMISDGLLVAGPRNGAMVAELDQNQLVELYFIREVLEGAAAELAARYASEAEISHLFEIAESELAVKGDPKQVAMINTEFHYAIYAAARNRYLLQSLSSVTDALGLLRYSSVVLPGSIEQSITEHMEIIKAIGDRDAKRAEKWARLHVKNALALRLKLLREHRNPAAPRKSQTPLADSIAAGHRSRSVRG